MQSLHLVIYCRHKDRGKFTTGCETTLWTFTALHQEFAWNRCSRLLVMTHCKSWCTPLSRLWTDLCRWGLRGAWEVMKPAWNTEKIFFPHPLEWPRPFAHLCWLPNCRRQKSSVQLGLRSGHRISGECIHLLHCLVWLSVIIKAFTELWHGAE